MTLWPVLRVLIAGVLASAGLFQLIWIPQRRHSPVEVRGCLLAALGLFFLSGAVLCLNLKSKVPCFILGAAGALFSLLWFYHIFRQSLHNTTM